MELRERVDKWIHGKYVIPDSVAQADKLIQELLGVWDDEKHLSEVLFARATRAENLAEKYRLEMIRCGKYRKVMEDCVAGHDDCCNYVCNKLKETLAE